MCLSWSFVRFSFYPRYFALLNFCADTSDIKKKSIHTSSNSHIYHKCISISRHLSRVSLYSISDFSVSIFQFSSLCVWITSENVSRRTAYSFWRNSVSFWFPSDESSLIVAFTSSTRSENKTNHAKKIQITFGKFLQLLLKLRVKCLWCSQCSALWQWN